MTLIQRTVLLSGLFCLSALCAMASDRPRIVAVNFALQSMAERLVGPDAEVILPVPEGIDPSFWRPKISDISLIQSADLIVLNGAGFATWVDRVSLARSRLVNSTAGLEARFIVTETITHSHGEGGAHSHEARAAYTWLDPSLAADQAQAIADALVRRGLGTEAAIAPRLDALRADLATIDQQAQALFANYPDTTLIATHPRYQYLARRYGITITALDWEPGTTPSDAQLERLGQLAQDTGAQVLLWEAEPTEEAKRAVDALGLHHAPFPPLAQRVPDQDLIASYAQSLRDLRAALRASRLD